MESTGLDKFVMIGEEVVLWGGEGRVSECCMSYPEGVQTVWIGGRKYRVINIEQCFSTLAHFVDTWG